MRFSDVVISGEAKYVTQSGLDNFGSANRIVLPYAYCDVMRHPMATATGVRM